MLVAEEIKLHTLSEYLEAEDAAAIRHEFHNGKVVEMDGGTLSHNAIKLRLAGTLDQYVASQDLPHMVLNSDTKVRIESANRFFYPDVTVSDGTPVYYTTPEGLIRRDIITNPLVVVEVLSEETRDYDKGEKFERYCAVPGFQEYILIEPDIVWAKSLFLQDPAEHLWKHEILTDKDAALVIRSLGLEIPLSALYAVLEKLPK